MILYHYDFVEWLVSDEDMILCDWRHMLFCTLLHRESIQLCLIRNKIDIIRFLFIRSYSIVISHFVVHVKYIF